MSTTKKGYKKNIFQCKYCSLSFSGRGAYRNHLQSHRDQMYLDENNLTREESTNISEPVVARNNKQGPALLPILINDIITPCEEQISDINVHDAWKVKYIYIFLRNLSL